MKSALRNLSVVGLLEGLSLLILVFIAVPAKHFYGHPGLVKVIGPIHGGIFLLYVAVAAIAWWRCKWKLSTALLLLLSSLVPFANFFVEYRIIRPAKRKIAEAPSTVPEESGTGTQGLIWLKRIGFSGFLFFLIKGLVWVAVFAGLLKGCD